MAGVVRNDDDLDQGNIYFSKNGNMCVNLCVDFASIWLQFCELSITDPDKACTIFEKELQGFDALQVVHETRVCIAEVGTTEIQLLSKVRILRYQRELLTDENRYFENQVVVLCVNKGCCEACESGGKRANADKKDDLANVQKAMCAVEEQESTDPSLRLSAVEDLNSGQDQLATTSAKLQTGKGLLAVYFDQLKDFFGSLKIAEVAVQLLMKFNLQNCIQAA